MNRNTKRIIGVVGLTAIGVFLYKYVFKQDDSKAGETGEFPIYPNPLCSDGTEGGCEYNEVVEDVQIFLNSSEGGLAALSVDGLFGDDTADAIESYIGGLADAGSSLGYNLVAIPNYITLDFYESIE